MARKFVSDQQLPLFTGVHLTDIAFRDALQRDDAAGAAAVAPEIWRPAAVALAEALQPSTPEARVQQLGLLAGEMPAPLQPCWHRLMGQALCQHTPVAVHAGQLAAWYLLQGGRADLARAALERHLAVRPTDPDGWQLLARWQPLRAATRCGFHGGPLLDEGHGSDAIAALVTDIQDEDLPIAPWLLTFAWFAGDVTTAELGEAVAAEGMLRELPKSEADDAKAFAAWLVEAERDPRDLHTRRKLQGIHAGAYRRWLQKQA